MKGIIVVDVPETCENCKLSEKTWYGNTLLITCPFMPYQVERDNKQNSEKFCPIKPLPEKMDIDVCASQSRYEAMGWNACIREMLKGETIEENKPHQEQKQSKEKRNE